jgi:hypothetical protein
VFSGILSGLFSVSVGKVINSIISWVAASAIYLTGEVGSFLNGQLQPDISSANFGHYLNLVELTSAALLLPLVFAAAIKLIVTQDIQGLIKLIGIHIPIALTGTALAVVLIKLLLKLTDNLSTMFLNSAGVDLSSGLENLGRYLTMVSSPSSNNLPGFFTLIILLVFIGGFVGLIIEMIIRSAAIELAVLFLPLAFMGIVWPSTSHWLRKMIDIIASLIFSKLIVVVIIAISIGQLTQSKSISIGSILEALSMLLLAVYCPFFLMHVIPAMEHFGTVSSAGNSFKNSMAEKAGSFATATFGGGSFNSSALESNEMSSGSFGANSVIDNKLSGAKETFSQNVSDVTTESVTSSSSKDGLYNDISHRYDPQLVQYAYDDILEMRKRAGLDVYDD